MPKLFGDPYEQEMLPCEIEDIPYSIDSISEHRPTQREILEHKNKLNQCSLKLIGMCNSFKDRLEKVRVKQPYGVKGIRELFLNREVNSEMYHKVIINIEEVDMNSKKTSKVAVQV